MLLAPNIDSNLSHNASSSMSNSDTVIKQWDVGNTSIASADKLLELIRGASEDNVQP